MKFKILFFTLGAILFCKNELLAQTQNVNYDKVDAIIPDFKKSDYKNPEDLAVALCKNLSSPREKARAIYTWLAMNIKYNINDIDRDPVSGENKDEIDIKKDEVAKKSYKKGKGICEDYSRLYRMMCKAVDVECSMVTGIARSGMSHAWNAVKLDDKWELIDVTWGSGYLDDNEKFHFRFNPGFFCTNPKLLIFDHFPKDPKWQMLEKPLSRQEYGQQMKKLYYSLWDIQDCASMDAPLAANASGEYEVFFTTDKKPGYIGVKNSGKYLISTNEHKDGKIIVRFKAGKSQKVEIFAGESRDLYHLIGKYKTM